MLSSLNVAMQPILIATRCRLILRLWHNQAKESVDLG